MNGRGRATGSRFPFQYALARAHCHATEERERVERALRTFVGPAAVRASKAAGHHSNPIDLLEARAEGQALRQMLTSLREAVGAQLLAELDRRLDDELFLYARLDKQAAYGARVVLSTGDDAIHVKAKVKAFPATRAEAARVVAAFLGEQPF